MSCILSKFSNFCAQINDALTFNTEAKYTTMIMLIGLNKNILPAHFYEDYKLDSNFVSCILSKFSNFCTQINDALTFNTEAKYTTMIMLIGLNKNILPAHFYEDYKLNSNFVSCILSKFSNFCAKINDTLIFNTEAKKTTIIILIGLSKNISPIYFYR